MTAYMNGSNMNLHIKRVTTMMYTTPRDLTSNSDIEGNHTPPTRWLTTILEENGKTLVVQYPKEESV